jgi:1-phosphofructokinase family hexose kinase
MIYTLLLNPTVDEIFEVRDFEVGGTFKADTAHVFPMGKAISVALTIRELGAPVHVFSFVGKNERDLYAQFLIEREISFTFVCVSGKTRSNKTVLDFSRRTITHIRLPGFEVSEENLREMLENIQRTINKGDFLCFSGSLPKGMSSSFLISVRELCEKIGAKFFMDSSGEPLSIIKKLDPFCIKGNLEEFFEIYHEAKRNPIFQQESFSKNITQEDLKRIGSILKGIINEKLHLITLGKEGSIAMRQNEIVYAEYRTDALYTVGCGDSYFGGFLYGLSQNCDLVECMKLATACGVANTEMLGAGILDKKSVEKYKDLVHIIRAEFM